MNTAGRGLPGRGYRLYIGVLGVCVCAGGECAAVKCVALAEDQEEVGDCGGWPQDIW